MNIKILEKLKKNGVFSELEVNEILKDAIICKNGRIITPLSDDAVFSLNKYNLEYDLSDEKVDDIEYLRNFVIHKIIPPLGGESLCKELNTFGYTMCGICDGWMWYRKDSLTEEGMQQGYRPIEDATCEELWKIIGLCSRYWEIFYDRLYHNES